MRTGRHINSFGLGDTGRYWTNVRDCAEVNIFSASQDDDLAMHPTVKPVALIGDAIRDCSKRGDIILDMFGGSGSTLIAAYQAGRQARLVECDPAYCDVIVARWEKLAGKTAVRVSCNFFCRATCALPDSIPLVSVDPLWQRSIAVRQTGSALCKWTHLFVREEIHRNTCRPGSWYGRRRRAMRSRAS